MEYQAEIGPVSTDDPPKLAVIVTPINPETHRYDINPDPLETIKDLQGREFEKKALLTLVIATSIATFADGILKISQTPSGIYNTGIGIAEMIAALAGSWFSIEAYGQWHKPIATAKEAIVDRLRTRFTENQLTSNPQAEVTTPVTHTEPPY